MACQRSRCLSNDPATRHYLERTLLEYRLAGVDKDDATRAKIRELQDKITALSLEFGRNVADGKLSITATKADLAGLPDDFIARHTAGGRRNVHSDDRRARCQAGDELRKKRGPAHEDVSGLQPTGVSKERGCPDGSAAHPAGACNHARVSDVCRSRCRGPDDGLIGQRGGPAAAVGRGIARHRKT